MARVASILVILTGTLVFACIARAGCRDAGTDSCGLVFEIKTDEIMYTPLQPIVTTIELWNRGTKPVFLPATFFKYATLGCLELPSGNVRGFKAIYPAPDCEAPPSDKDVLLEPGQCFEYDKTVHAYPEPGTQKLSFEALLYRCPNIPFSVNCEIESNTAEFVVREE